MSGETPQERWKNEVKCRQSRTQTKIGQSQQIQSQENTEKDLKISKTAMADRWVIVQVKKIDRLQCVAI